MSDVAVRIGSLDADERAIAAYSRVIDAAEQCRATQFHFPRDRRRFIVRRAKLRLWLGAMLGQPGDRLTFTQNAWGKPELASGDLHFSLSSSGEVMMLATAEVEVGCDIEWMDDTIDWQPLAARFFTAAECAAIAGCGKTQAYAAFYDCWTRKEAFVKALGQGLSYPLDAFDVSPGSPARFLRGGEGFALSGSRFLDNYASSIAVRGNCVNVLADFA